MSDEWREIKSTKGNFRINFPNFEIKEGKDVQNVLAAGVDFVTIGRSAILHHNFPELVTQNPDFEPIANPVSKAHLAKEGLGEAFITYMKRWQGFVEE